MAKLTHRQSQAAQAHSPFFQWRTKMKKSSAVRDLLPNVIAIQI
jgi:hypothetical protein